MPDVVFPAQPVTALQIIDRAYSIMGYKAAGETITADDAQYALSALNSMLDLWNTQRLFIVTISDVVATVSTGSATVGAGQVFDIERPSKIEVGAFCRISGSDFPIEVIDRTQYAALMNKSMPSTQPIYAYYDDTLTTGTVYFYPVPTSAVEIHLPFQLKLSGFADLATAYTLAAGYRAAIEYSLAEELSPGVREIDPIVSKKAANARRMIKRVNTEVPRLNSVPFGIPSRRLNPWL